jgi:hypothetical protein
MGVTCCHQRSNDNAKLNKKKTQSKEKEFKINNEDTKSLSKMSDYRRETERKKKINDSKFTSSFFS